MRLLAIPLLLALAACATEPTYTWQKPGGSEYEFDSDAGQCRAQAYSVPGVRMLQAVLVFENCLQGKGWRKTAR